MIGGYSFIINIIIIILILISSIKYKEITAKDVVSAVVKVETRAQVMIVSNLAEWSSVLSWGFLEGRVRREP